MKRNSLEWEKGRCGERERETEREREREQRGGGGCWEKDWDGLSPFNLLINHANEILTGYSEAVLGGARQALVLDYTLSVWRAEKEKRNMLLNKVMGNFSAHCSRAEPRTAWKECNVFVGTHTQTQTAEHYVWPGHMLCFNTRTHMWNRACSFVKFTMAMLLHLCTASYWPSHMEDNAITWDLRRQRHLSQVL